MSYCIMFYIILHTQWYPHLRKLCRRWGPRHRSLRCRRSWNWERCRSSMPFYLAISSGVGFFNIIPHMYRYLYIYIYIHVRLYIYIYVYMFIYLSIYIYRYMDVYVNTTLHQGVARSCHQRVRCLRHLRRLPWGAQPGCHQALVLTMAGGQKRGGITVETRKWWL